MGHDPGLQLVSVEADELTDLGVRHTPLVAKPADEAKADAEALSHLFRLEHRPSLHAR